MNCKCLIALPVRDTGVWLEGAVRLCLRLPGSLDQVRVRCGSGGTNALPSTPALARHEREWTANIALPACRHERVFAHIWRTSAPPPIDPEGRRRARGGRICDCGQDVVFYFDEL